MSDRRGAFDPARLDDELDVLLPPTATKSPAHQEQTSPPAHTAAPASSEPVTTENTSKTVPARIARSLYDELSNALAGLNERPSYAQIIAWACTKHSEDVRDLLLAKAAHDAKALRGRRPAQDQTTIAPRFLPDELAALDNMIDRVVQQSVPARKITRTAAISAAIQSALQNGLPTAEDIANSL